MATSDDGDSDSAAAQPDKLRVSITGGFCERSAGRSAAAQWLVFSQRIRQQAGMGFYGSSGNGPYTLTYTIQ